MKLTNFDEFKKLTNAGNVIPIFKELIVDIDTPVSIFSKFNSSKFAFLLESVETDKNYGRYSIIGIDPFKLLRYANNILEVSEGTKKTVIENTNPLDYLNADLKKFKSVEIDDIPFLYSAIIGYFGFEIFGLMEKTNFTNTDELDIPDIYLAYCNKLLVFDHFKNKLFLIYNAILTENSDVELEFKKGIAELESLEKIIFTPIAINYISHNKSSKIPVPEYVSPEKSFIDGVNKIKEYINKGDIFQCVLSIRQSVKISVEPFELYRALRIINPSPYMFYMNFDNFTLIGSSPETMVRIRSNKVYLKPIAGTRPVLKNETETQMYADEMMRDEKELAEHIMLLDLGRNDLGRICKPGTVKVEKKMYVERFAHVQHIVSDVSGELAEGNSVIDVLKASFPAGTVSGAPKIRAMEIINELEPIKRNFYAGAAGYITFGNEMDLAITIRSMTVKNGTVYFQTGAGIVYDSIDKNELKECVNKAKSIVESIYLAETGIERI
ncbi:chorismate-binding protein [Candidatus Dependentiae bacterium]|nr:chorismate-binding protein [Candidatus Dependentiae bacterium]